MTISRIGLASLVVLVAAGCGSGASGGTGFGIDTGTPASQSDIPASQSDIPASQSDTPPSSSQTPPSQSTVCTDLCNWYTKYQCVDPSITPDLCVQECVANFDQVTSNLSVACLGTFLDWWACADKAGAVSCKVSCPQGTDQQSQQPHQGCTSKLEIDLKVAQACTPLLQAHPECVKTSSTNTCDSITDPCAKCLCQNNNDATACTNECAASTGGGGCTYPDCSGCGTATPCQACTCANQGSSANCTALCP